MEYFYFIVLSIIWPFCMCIDKCIIKKPRQNKTNETPISICPVGLWEMRNIIMDGRGLG